MERAHILISGRNADLLATRGLVLQSAGYRVSTSLQPIDSLANLDQIQLLILCHTLDSEEQRADLSALSVSSPAAKVLCLEPCPGTPKPGLVAIDALDGPREMVRVVHQLLQPAST